MDKELIERLAREAGFDTDDGQITMPHHHADGPANERSHLERFAALVAEECAKVVEKGKVTFAESYFEINERLGDAAAAIRENFCAKG